MSVRACVRAGTRAEYLFAEWHLKVLPHLNVTCESIVNINVLSKTEMQTYAHSHEHIYIYKSRRIK